MAWDRMGCSSNIFLFSDHLIWLEAARTDRTDSSRLGTARLWRRNKTNKKEAFPYASQVKSSLLLRARQTDADATDSSQSQTRGSQTGTAFKTLSLPSLAFRSFDRLIVLSPQEAKNRRSRGSNKCKSSLFRHFDQSEGGKMKKKKKRSLHS